MRLPLLIVAMLPCWSGCDGSDSQQQESHVAPPADAGATTMNVSFVDVARELGLTEPNVCGSYENHYILESLGSGAGWFDHDGDGDLELYVVNGARLESDKGETGPNQLYRNDGERFTDISTQAGVACERWGIGCAIGDVDSDGSPDVYVANWGGNRMYVQSDGRFTDLAPEQPLLEERMSTSAAFGDYDHDGDLDLYVANYVRFDPERPPNQGRPCHWHTHSVYCGPDGLTAEADGFYENDGSGHFQDATASAGLDAEAGFGLGVIFGDYDLDGDADLYVANDSTPNFLFQNQGDKRFVEVAIALGAGHSEDGEEQAGMGVDMGDYDNDGDQDIFVTNFSDDYNTLYRNEKGRFFKDVSAFAGLVHTSVYSLGWGTHFADFDHDGHLDLFVANGHVYPQADQADANTSYRQRNQLFHNTGMGAFREVASPGSGFEALESTRGSALGDFDGDGDLDLFLVNEGAPPTLLRNESSSSNRWMRIRLRGASSNRFGIGALVRIHAGGRTQLREVRRGAGFASSQEPVAHFGLGSAETIERVEVDWPGGQTERFRNLSPNKTVLLTQGSPDPEVLSGD